MFFIKNYYRKIKGFVLRESVSQEEIFSPNALFGQYRVIRKLGRGNLGEVYEVEHTVLKRRFALKVFFSKFYSEPNFSKVYFAKLFYTQLKTLAELEHPNIIKVYEYGETEELYWIIMELGGGAQSSVRTLAELAEQGGGKVEQSVLVNIIHYVLEGLGYLHMDGIIHGNLKPENIFLPQSETEPNKIEVKIADFGLLRIVGDGLIKQEVDAFRFRKVDFRKLNTKSSRGENRTLLRSYEYLSPEQVCGRKADPRSDIYTVGLMLFKLVTSEQLRSKKKNKLYSRVVVSELEELIINSIDEQPINRYHCAEEMLMQLQEVIKTIKVIKQKERRIDKKYALKKRKKVRFLFRCLWGVLGLAVFTVIVWDICYRPYSKPPNTFGHQGYYNKANNLIIEGRYDEAIKNYTKAIRLNTQHLESYYNRGNAFLYKKEYEAAITDYNKAIELNPKHVESYYNRGAVFVYQGKYVRAIADYSTSIKLDSSNAQAYYNRGTAFAYEREYDKAIKDYTAAIDRAPRNAKIYFNRGTAFVSLGRFNKAIEDYTKTILLDPNNAKAYYNRGALYSKKGLKEKAIADYNRAVELNPDYEL